MTRTEYIDLLLFILRVESELSALLPDAAPEPDAYHPYYDDLIAALRAKNGAN